MTGKHTNTGSSQATEAGSRSAGDATTHKVVVVFKRVQTFLFASAQFGVRHGRCQCPAR